jgi:arylsulfatase A-like enzyme
MTPAQTPASTTAEPTLPPPTFWSLFSCALAALGLLWMPLIALQWLDGLLVMQRPAEILRDLALWWPLVLVPAALFAGIAWLVGAAARLRLSVARAALPAWSVLLLPVLWLCAWQLGRTGWLWLKLQTGLNWGIAPGVRIAAVIVIALLLLALLRRRGADRSVRWFVGALSALRMPALALLAAAVATTLWQPPMLSLDGRTERPADAATAPASAPDIFLITLDSVAAEDANVCGSGPTMMPRLRAFAQRRGTCFERYYASGNFTTPTTSTMETGRLPWSHLAVQPDARVVNRVRATTMAQSLRRAGYRTIAVTDNLLASPRHRGTYVGYDRNVLLPTPLLGETLREAVTVLPDTSLPRLTMSALGLLGALDIHRHGENSPYESQRVYDEAWRQLHDASDQPRRPLFLWAHTFPPHSPYLAPASTRNRLLPAGELSRWQDQLSDNIAYPPRLQPLVDKHRLRYRESLLAADQALGEFIDRLDRAGRLDRALVIVTSDHGESFDHGYLGHAGPRLHDVLLRIPMVVKLPQQRHGRTVVQPVSQADLAPTVLDLVAAPALPAAEGRSLRTLLEGAALESRPVYAMSMEHQSRFRPLRQGRYAVIDGAHKLVWDLRRERTELYNLTADPRERVDLSATQGAVVERLRALLRDRLAEAEVRRAQELGS